MTNAAKTWIGFVAMCVGMFMAILDIQVVASSLTNMQAALHISPDRMSWIQTGYLIAARCVPRRSRCSSFESFRASVAVC